MYAGSKYKTPHETTVPAIMQEVLATRTHVVVRLYVICAYLPKLHSDITMDTLHNVRKMGRKTWNWIEKKTGVDLDRDGDTGETQAVQHVGDGNYFKVRSSGVASSLSTGLTASICLVCLFKGIRRHQQKTVVYLPYSLRRPEQAAV